MANTRPFTYNNGSPISGTNQIGDLAYGDLNPVNGGPNYDNNPGGKKWWMGPDEDNRYIIGKDVPTMDHPTSTPEGNIGSVRFWGTDTESDTEFLFWVNRLPGRVGLGPISDPSTAYSWLISNGYFTNYPTVFSEYGTFYTYESPTDIGSQALGVLYSSANNKLFINTDNNGTTSSKDYGNFVIPNWTTEAANISSSVGQTKFYSGSSYNNQWLPSATQNGGSKRITSGFMALDDVDDFLFVQGKHGGGDENGRGIIKYDISVNPPTIEVSSSIDMPNGLYTKIAHERSSNLVICTNGLDTGDNNNGFLFDGDTLDFEGYLLNSNSNQIDSTRFATSGPAGYILLTRELATDYYIFKLDSTTNPNKAIDDGFLNFDYLNERDTPQPVYVSAKNKWYVPYKRTDSARKNQTRNQGLDVIDGTTFNRTTYTFGSEQNTSGTNLLVKQPSFFLYDSIRDYFWTTSPVYGNIIAIDADDFSTQISTETSGFTRGEQQSAVIADDKLIIVRPDSGNPIKIFDLASLVIV